MSSGVTITMPSAIQQSLEEAEREVAEIQATIAELRQSADPDALELLETLSARVEDAEATIRAMRRAHGCGI